MLLENLIKFATPYKDGIASFNTVVTVFLALSPIILIINVIKGKEDYKNMPVLMFLTNVLNNLLWGCFWFRNNEALTTYCSFGCAGIGVVFLICYTFFYSEKNYGKFVLLLLAQFAAECGITYIFIKDFINVDYLGAMIVVINVFQYVAPSQNLVRVIKEKNYSLIPIFTTIIGTICSGGWLLFGLIVNKLSSIISNGIALFVSILTTGIYYYYYFRYPKKEDKEVKKDELIESTEVPDNKEK
jgi:hypothetical protein